VSTQSALSELRVNGERLWDTLMAMAEVGKTKAGGSHRLALTDEDKAGQELFIGWAEEAGCRIARDEIGNLFAERAGRDESSPQVMIGSHLDTVFDGGRFDGPVGVLIGLEIVRTLNENTITTRAPITIVSWANEEGARFPQPATGSGVFSGVLTLENALAQESLDGPTLGEELVRLGLVGPESVGARRAAAYFEAHIEQGRLLESSRSVIGVVTGGIGVRAIRATLTGSESHVATTTMHDRRDALVGAARIVEFARQLANEVDGALLTVGYLTVEPNARNLIPSRVELTVDVRHRELGPLVDLEHKVSEGIRTITHEAGLAVELTTFLPIDPVVFDHSCNQTIRDVATELGHPVLELMTGAAHDATYLTRAMPTALMFIPCRGGVTHNAREYASPEHVEAGCNVVMHAVLRWANSHI
jgi:N-carbamoyl-L-amino-acid hydrolase